MSGYGSGFSVYRAFVENQEFFQLYLSLAISALEYPETCQLFANPQRFPSWAQVDQTILPSYLGSIPNLADLGNFCYDDETFYQAFSYTYGPEYANVIYALFADLLGNAPVTLTPFQGSAALFPGLPPGSRMYQCTYQPYIEQQFATYLRSQGSYYLCVPLPLHYWFESLLTGSIWTSGTQSLQFIAANDVSTALLHLVPEDSWLWPYSLFANGTACVLGMVESMGNAQAVGQNTYRITAANPTMIRYIAIVPYQAPVYVPPPAPAQPAEPEVVHEKPLDRNVEEKLAMLERAFSGSGSVNTNKRIINEYKSIHTSKGIQGVRVEFEGGNNMYVWMIFVEVKYFDLPKALKKDFDTYAKKCRRPAEIIFEARFDSGYPQTPPFLRVVSPRFAFHTGHITIGGSICTESLTRQGWSSARTIESILIEVISNMGVGNARLDGRQMGYDYTLGEAQEAFHRVARQHGWQ